MFLNFGEIGDNIRQLVNKFQQTTKSHENLETIADMKKFVENYPAFKAMSGTVSKHVAVVGELSRLVEANHLLEVSEVEQELACQGNHMEALGKLRSLLVHMKVKDHDKLRLVLLYLLRYERNESVLRELLDTLEHQGVHGVEAVSALRRYAGDKSPCRSRELFGERTAVGRLKRLVGGVKGVENIYTQHVPVLGQLLDQMAKGRLAEASFPLALEQQGIQDRFQDVIVFIVGGCTY
jgi:vacuolar protein sorting-associated protein 45